MKDALSLSSETLFPQLRLCALVSRGPLLALVELDVAPAWMAATQITAGEITVGQLNLEYVVAAGLAFVAYSDSGCARLTIDRNIIVDDTTSPVARINRVARDGGVFDVLAVAMIYVVQVAPERAVLDAPGHTEVGLRSRRRPGDPATAGHEVARRSFI